MTSLNTSAYRSLVVHCKKTKHDTYVGRPSIFGNPFHVGRDGDRDSVVRRFEEWVWRQPELLRMIRSELRGHTLGCYCAPDFPCHGEVLAAIANSDIDLPTEPVFVFGSNLAGRHGAGAAKFAQMWRGARSGVGVGIAGSSYALPTKNERLQTLPLSEIRQFIDRFLECAAERNDLTFQVTRVGCGLAGYKDADIAPMFSGAPANCLLPALWEPYRSGPQESRLIVAGSRSIVDSDRVAEHIDRITARLPRPFTVVSGGAHGVDQLGEDWATVNTLWMRRIPAEFRRFGKPAGPIRNQFMSWYSTHLLAFWDGKSPGTKNMITTARADGLNVRVIRSHA